MTGVDIHRIEFISSVGTLGKDPEDFQVGVFLFSWVYHAKLRSESHRIFP